MEKPEITFFEDKFTRNAGISLQVLRLDKLHSITGGNKWYKLKPVFSAYQHLPDEEKPVLISFGGCFSNLIAALAMAGSENRFKTIGIIRGEKRNNITLNRAEKNGMKLFFVPRSVFADQQKALERIQHYVPEFHNAVVIPQGAADMNGYVGCKEILSRVSETYDFILCPSATGTTLAGMAAVTNAKCIGIAILKNKEEQLYNIRCFFQNDGINRERPWVMDDYHQGGMAKTSMRLKEFLDWFSAHHPEVPVEPVYTGKMMFGVYDLLKNGYFRKGSRVLCIHTGGMQYLHD